jgi:HAD superfamily hydrolase (TIGR01549 family)
MEHPKGLRGVLFDMDGTLYRQGLLRGLMGLELARLPFELHSFRAAARALRILRTFRTVREELRHEPDGGESLSRLQYDRAGMRAGVPSVEVERLVAEWMYRRPLKYLAYCKHRGVDEFLAQLSQRGVRIGIFSDYPVQDKLDAMGLTKFVSLMLCATDAEINALKPHPRGFQRACELWGLKPTEVLYVGDRVDVDAGGAAAAGMPCALFARSGRGAPAVGAGAGRCFTFTSFEGLAHVLHTSH